MKDKKLPGNNETLVATLRGASLKTLRALLQHEATHQRRRHVLARLQGRINRLELASVLAKAKP